MELGTHCLTFTNSATMHATFKLKPSTTQQELTRSFSACQAIESTGTFTDQGLTDQVLQQTATSTLALFTKDCGQKTPRLAQL